MTSDKTNDQQFAKVAQKLDPQNKLRRAWDLVGGISAQVTALEIEQPDGQIQKVIVRLHGEADRAENPQIAADEYKLLSQLHAAGIAAPKPYLVDQSLTIFEIPYVVIEFIEGQTEFSPPDLSDFLRQSAEHLAWIHRVDGAAFAFLPDQNQRYGKKISQRPAILDDSLHEGRIRDVLEAAYPFVQHNPSGLLHGDYWAGNLMWRDRQLVAVIDWEDAKIGDPLSDVGNARLEMLWAFGMEAMHEFTDCYQTITNIDFRNLPYWDLFAALRPMFRLSEWVGDAEREKHMREGHRLFIEQAFEKLANL